MKKEIKPILKLINMNKFSMFLLLFTNLIGLSLNAQKTTIINFTGTQKITQKKLEQVPAVLRPIIIEQVKNVKIESTIYLCPSGHLFISKSKSTSVNKSNLGAMKLNGKNGQIISASSKVTSPPDRIEKKEELLIFREGREIKKKPLQKASWKVTTIKKNILNYNCTMATTIFDGMLVTVYFTTEILGKASPFKYPFINGIILEYDDEKSHGIATKVEFNQPDIKDFFK